MLTETSFSGIRQPKKSEFVHFESFEEPVFVMDTKGDILYANSIFTERFLKSPHIGADLNLFVQDSSRPVVMAFHADWESMSKEVLRTNERFTFDKDLDECTLRYTLYPYNSSHLLVIAQDITEQKRFERQARQGKELLSALVNAIPASVIIVDANMHLVGWNRFSQETINGKSEKEMMSGVNPFGRVHPDDLYELKKLFFNILKLDVEESAEFRMFHKDGPPYKWATIRGKRIIIEEKPCVIAVVTETTDLVSAEERRNSQESRLHQIPKMELLGQFTGGIAHDFNNSLTGILINTEQLLEKLDPELPFVENIRDIRRSALVSADMTRKLLDFVRNETSEPEIICLNKEIENLIPMLKRMIGENIRIEWAPGGSDPQVRIDPSQVDQIVSNLCINARDAISGSGKIIIATGSIHVEQSDCDDGHPCLSPGEYVSVSISDNGSGIDTQTLPHIFEPFFTTKSADKGTGLGLSLVRGTLQQNNGFIDCRSNPGKGTTFNVYLPEYRESAMQPAAPQSEPLPELPIKTILLVEDEINILKFIKDILEEKGFTVFAAQDAETACRIFARQSSRIDLLITDIILPKMNGVQLARKLTDAQPDMKLLFMSGYAPETLCQQRSFEEGVDFIQKPFGLHDFMKIVHQTLVAPANQ